MTTENSTIQFIEPRKIATAQAEIKTTREILKETEKTVLDLYKEELKRVRLSTLEEVYKKFISLGKEGEESTLKHSVNFYRWLKGELK